MRTTIAWTAVMWFSLGVGGCSASAGSASAGGAGAGGAATAGTGGVSSGGHGASAHTGATGGTGTGGTGATAGSGAVNGSGGTHATGGAAGASGTDLNAAACAVNTPLSGGNNVCSSNGGTLSNGVAYSVWCSDNATGTHCGNFYDVGAAFKATWDMPGGGDFLARAGLQWDKTKTYDLLGTISADYAFKKTTSNAITFIGIYGWSTAPLVEFYILEERDGGWDPRSDGQKHGSLSVDGGTYELWTRTQTNQPSIEGTQTFQQYWSIRTSARECGHISVSEHFKQWSKVGMQLGKMYEAKLLVEAVGGSGTVDFTNARVTAK